MSSRKSQTGTAEETDVVVSAIGPLEDAARTIAFFVLRQKPGGALCHGVVYRAGQDVWYAVTLGRLGSPQPPLEPEREARILSQVQQLIGEDLPQRERRTSPSAGASVKP